MELLVTRLDLYFTGSGIRLGVEIIGLELQKRGGKNKKKKNPTHPP